MCSDSQLKYQDKKQKKRKLKMTQQDINPNPDFYEIRKEYPAEFRKTSYGYFAGFEKAAFGYIEIEIDADEDEEAVILLGEMYDPFYHRINRRALKNVRNIELVFKVERGRKIYKPAIPSWTGLLKSPAGTEVAPFRYAELRCKGKVTDRGIVRNSLFGKIPEKAASFRCSNPMLEKVWDFCHYSMRATSFFGCFVDGDRERLPYEGDSYVSALSCYAVSADADIVRRTIDYLMKNPTWPTEYMLLMPIIVRDYLLYTGDTESVKNWYPFLKNKHLLPFTFEGVLIDMRRAHETWSDERIMEMTGLGKHFAHWMRDMVDWPPCERDRYWFGDAVVPKELNWLKGAAVSGLEIAPPIFVPNAVQAAANDAYAFLAEFLNHPEEAARHRDRAEKIRTELRRTMHRKSEPKGLFADHPGAEHTACHTDVFALWANIAEEENRSLIANRLAQRGMRCSVYGAAFLLDALFTSGLPADALKLMADTSGLRSWASMLNQGATITKEEWDDFVDEGLDWNHAWATAPLHIIPRGLFGIRPTAPGFSSFTVKPQLAFLEYARLEHPTVKGTIKVEVRRLKGEEAEMDLEVPEGTTAFVTFGKTQLEAESGRHLIKGELPLE